MVNYVVLSEAESHSFSDDWAVIFHYSRHKQGFASIEDLLCRRCLAISNTHVIRADIKLHA